MGRSVLVVDDLVFYRHRIRNLLRRLGYVVYEAGEGEEACRIARTARPDAVLLDQVMIGLSGLETLQRLREEGFEGSVIVLSPRPDAPEARELLRAGARGLLPKAVSASRIEAELRDAFDQASAA
jgi:DNA-binding NarL/FixJ family response regulator